MSSPQDQEFTFHPSLSPLNQNPSVFLSANPHITHLMTATIVFRSLPPPLVSLPGSTSSPEDRVLLLRRAASDSYPLKWELSGGSVDIQDDASVLSAAARELWEETSLRVTRFHRTVGMISKEEDVPGPEVVDWGIQPEKEISRQEVYFFEKPSLGGEDRDGVRVITFLETGATWGKITFSVDVQDTSEVKIREDEHAEWAWVTEKEVQTGWITSPSYPSPSSSGVTNGQGVEKRVLSFVSEAVRRNILEGFKLRRAFNA